MSINISEERYAQLIRAEQDANRLKAMIAYAYEEYRPIDRGDLTVLYTMFIGKKEENHE